MMGCKKCSKVSALIFLVLGVWDFWNVQWWTALFLLMGLCSFAMGSCPDCCQEMKSSTKKK